MVIPIGDENPRSSTPVVSWVFAALTGVAFVVSMASGSAVGGALGFFLSPILAPDLVTAIWSILALVILADNVEDRIGPLYHACLLIAAGWAGAAARTAELETGLRPMLAIVSVKFPFAGAGAAATAAAVAYAIFFPLREIRFFNLFVPRRRYGWSIFDGIDRNPPTFQSTFYVTSPLGIFLWGIGILAGAFLGGRTAGDLGALVLGGLAGGATAFFWNMFSPRPALPSEIELPAPAPRATQAFAPVAFEPIEVPGGPKPLLPPPVFDIEGWAVLRETDELFDVGRLGRAAAKYMGIPVVDATRRIRQTRGVLARRMEKSRAAEMARAVTEAGVPAFAVEEAATGGLPQAQMAASCGCGAPGLEFELEGAKKATIGWGDVLVISAARIDESDQSIALADLNPSGMDSPSVVTRDRVTQTTLIDVVTRSGARVRVARQESASATSGDISSSGFRQFAASALKNRGAAPVNKGLSVISSRGTWGYLAFENSASYEEYLWWLIQVIRRRSGKTAVPATSPAAGAGGATSYLE